MKIVKKIVLFVLAALILLVAVVLFNTLSTKSKQIDTEAVTDFKLRENVAQTLSEAIQIPTITVEREPQLDSAVFYRFQQFLFQKFPLCDSLLEKTIINKLSIVYKFAGKNPNLKPIILVAHMDIVPVEGESKSEWEQAPYSGVITDGYIWGRGSLDDKISVLSILESAEMLLNEGFTPERTIYFAFGHDEEIGGANGAVKIVDWFKKQNIKAEMIMDEGLVITDGIVPGMEKPVALIGIAEKGHLSVELSVKVKGGHSSMPPRETAIGILSAAIAKLQVKRTPAKLTVPVQGFIEKLGAELPFVNRMAFTNTWLFSGIIKNIYDKTPAGSALIRTTIAPTIFRSGVKENVLPSQAVATINFRTLPGTSSDDVIAYITQVFDDKRITVHKLPRGSEPSPISPHTSEAYKVIEKSIKQIFTEAVIAPSLVLAFTDGRHYKDLSENVYKFLPVKLESADLLRIHGINERVSVEGYKNSIKFYYQLMKNFQY